MQPKSISVDAVILELWRNGVFFSRWAPDLLFGFGYPIFNYYGPFAYFVAGLFSKVLGGLAPGISATLVCANLVSALGMFYWLRRVSGVHGALIASAGYVLAPYVINTMYVRGALAESVALALIPWALGGFRNYMETGNLKHGLVAALAIGLTGISHNVAAMQLVIAFALYV